MSAFDLSISGSLADLFMDFEDSVVDTDDDELEAVTYSDEEGKSKRSSCSDGTDDTSESEESYTSYSTQSSFGFQMDASFTIFAPPDPFDDMSTMVDSVASDRSWRSRSTARSLKSVKSSQKMPPDVLSSISEEQQEADEHEAFLRAKMTSLWTRIQESAQKDIHDLSAGPSTDEDKELLQAYAIKKDTLSLLSKTTQ